MKKIFFILMTLLITSSVKSQDIQIIKEGSQEVVDVYNNTSNNKYKVVISPIDSVDANGHEYVDLVLPSGTLWATLNVGANNLTDTGTGFAWGETEPKNEFNISTYKWYEKGKYTKYYSGDGKSTLDLDDDAARANWGGDWQIPSLDDVAELFNNCTLYIVSDGIKAVSKNDNSKYIILPYNTQFWMNTLTNIQSAVQARIISTINQGSIRYDGNINRTSLAAVRPIIKIKPIVNSITLNKTDITIEGKGSVLLTATATPKLVGGNVFEWKSSNTRVATVSQNGKVTSYGSGEATITCKVKDSNISATCHVSVTEVPITSFSLNKTSAVISCGDYVMLYPTVLPMNATSSTCSWKSSNTSVATVVDGKVTGVSVGSAVITCKTGAGTMEKTCSISVKTPNIAQIKLSETDLYFIYDNDSQKQLQATVGPTQADATAITWSSSNTSVATVSASGLVNVVGPGTATITCSSTNSIASAQCNVTVYSLHNVTDIKFLSTNEFVGLGQKHKLATLVIPSNASYKHFKWTSSNTAVATVDSDGVVTGLSKGTATITCTTIVGGNVSSSVLVTVGLPSIESHTYVDLGLPSGNLWSTCNLGAASPEDYGTYYKWGETTEFNAKALYKFSDSNSGNITKYGRVDNKETLENADDAAHKNWNDNWYIPMSKDVVELCQNCDIVSTTSNGVFGTRYTSKNNGQSIFIPSAGYYNENGILCSATSCAYFWTSSLYTSNYNYALYNSVNASNLNRKYGLPIRPVNKIGLKIQSISIPKDISVSKGATYSFNVTILPSGCSKKVVWRSFDSNIAYFSNSSIYYLTAKNFGTTTIVCEAADGSGVIATCRVTVY